MVRPSKSTLLAFIAATIVGACLHFLYTLLPNPLTACLSPVRESLWEHLKLLYWPSLTAVLVLARREGKTRFSQQALALLLACVLMLAVGFVTSIGLGWESMAFDIGLYVVLMAGIFLLSPLLPEKWCRPYSDIILFLTLVLGGAILLFTFLPPRNALFADLSLTSQYTFFAGW